MKTNDKYLGWTNYETWNVILWINNSEEFYFPIMDILNHFLNTPTYEEIIYLLGLDGVKTSDGVSFLDEKLNYEELNEAIENMRVAS
ncbi:MAG: hypothetical protein U9N59_08715 [Campylobacterota bacterium]|nr:hypothetical protein [Campylobacterota bacterium]